MVKRCIYCSVEINPTSVVDMCQRCMHQVWGPKMSAAIIANMESESAKGNLELGRVSETRVSERIPIQKEEDHNYRFEEATKHDVEDIARIEKEGNTPNNLMEIEEISSSEVEEINFY